MGDRDFSQEMGRDRTPLRHLDMSPVADPGSIVQGDHYRISVLTDGLLRLEYAADGRFEDRASTFAIKRHLSVPDYQLLDTKDGLEIRTKRFHLTYDKKPFSPNGLAVTVPLASIHNTQWKVPWRYGTDHYPGLGGTARTLDGADGRIPLEAGVLARDGISLLDDSTSMLFTNDGWIAPRRSKAGTPDRLDLYLFCFGHDYRAAMNAFYAVSGPQPILPRWSLGNWWSRYYMYTQTEYIELMDRFRREEIPMSVGVLDMNWHREHDVPTAYGTGWTGYSWDKALFPDPVGFTKALHDRSLRVTANDHPADGVRAFEDAYKSMAEAVDIDPESGDQVVFDVTSRKFMTAYFDVLHRKLEDEDGIDFWWLDWQQGAYSKVADVDPLWVLNHFEFLTNGRKRRPITFSRFAGPGSHRYPVGFSGDTVVSWESLAFQPEFTATASNIGYGFWSNDIGGHMDGYKDDELATRWVQLGVFSPINRLHSALSQFNRKEPWNFNPEAREAMTIALRWRHRLVPYIYTMNYRSAAYNEPLVVPLYWDHPSVDEAYEHRNQFCFGTQLIVAPITSPSSRVTLLGNVRAYLPVGVFVDIFTGAVYSGDRKVDLHRRYDQIPVLAPQGAIIPLDAGQAPENGCPLPDTIEVLVIVGQDGAFELVEDDGSGRKLADTKFGRTKIVWEQKSSRLTIHAMEGEKLLLRRAWRVRFKTVHTSAVGALSDAKGQYRQWQEGQDHVIDVPPAATTSDVVIDLDPELSVLAPFDLNSCVMKFLDRAQTYYHTKEKIMEILETKTCAITKIGKLAAVKMDDDLRGAVMEYLLAR